VRLTNGRCRKLRLSPMGRSTSSVLSVGSAPIKFGAGALREVAAQRFQAGPGEPLPRCAAIPSRTAAFRADW